MILSLPNSGTDWLCPILAKHGHLRYYEKEYFNPICNLEYGDVLAAEFGCEMVSSYRNIGVRSSAQAGQLETVYSNTWARQSVWNFDKEIFSAFKVPFFNEHFRLVFLHRAFDSIFPPSRARVWSWYDAIWNGLADRDHVADIRLTLALRAREAHRVCWEEMNARAEELSAPVLDYDLLCTADYEAVRHHLGRGWIGDVVDVSAAAQEILTTRVHRIKTAAALQ